MTNKPKLIGWATTIASLISMPREMWNSVMTIENSPLRKLDPRAAHMIFQCLAFVWSGIFAAMIGSYQAFGFSAVFHVLFLAGVFITAMTFKAAETNTLHRNYSGRGPGGEHE